MNGKKGKELIETWEIVVALILVGLLVAGAILLLSGKGGQMLAALKDALRFGGGQYA